MWSFVIHVLLSIHICRHLYGYEYNFEYGIQRDQIGNDTLNHRTIMKYMINCLYVWICTCLYHTYLLIDNHCSCMTKTVAFIFNQGQWLIWQWFRSPHCILYQTIREFRTSSMFHCLTSILSQPTHSREQSRPLPYVIPMKKSRLPLISEALIHCSSIYLIWRSFPFS